MLTRSKKRPAIFALPPELLDQILDDISILDICNLRLSCQNLANRLWNSRFRQYIVDARTDLTVRGLERLLALVNNDALRLNLRSLTLRAVVYDTSYCERSIQRQQNRMVFLSADESTTIFGHRWSELNEEQLERVQQILNHLEVKEREQNIEFYENGLGLKLLEAAFSKIGKLDCLSIQAVAYANKDVPMPPVFAEWREVWITAAKTYFMTMKALARSELQLEELDVYSKTLGFSVPINFIWKYARRLRINRIEESYKSLRKLSLSLSTPPKLLPGDLEYSQGGYSLQPDLLRFPAPVLKYCTNLETLKLHMFLDRYGTHQRLPEIGSGRGYMTAPISRDKPVLPSLKHLELDGLAVDWNWIIEFLSGCPALETLVLRAIDLRAVGLFSTDQGWVKVFEYCAKDMSNLQLLNLDRLMAHGYLIQFFAQAGGLITYPNPPFNGYFRRQWEGEAIRQGISFRLTSMTTPFIDFRSLGEKSPRWHHGPALRAHGEILFRHFTLESRPLEDGLIEHMMWP